MTITLHLKAQDHKNKVEIFADYYFKKVLKYKYYHSLLSTFIKINKAVILAEKNTLMTKVSMSQTTVQTIM